MVSFRAAPVRVQVPASSANLGPGFDSAGLALALHDHVVVRVADSGLSVQVAGEGAEDLPRDKRHLVVATLRTAFDRLGGQPRGLEVVCANRIPQARGLGSSSAAIVAAILAARALVLGGEELLDDAAVLALATEVEGHPDNVAACLHGGFVLAWSDAGGVGVLRSEVHPDLVPLAFVPTTRASTRKVRGLLPATVPHADAAANSGRAALLVPALTGRPDPALLLAATADRLHQSYRASAMPRSFALVERLRADGHAAVVSGAGPTVLALVPRGVADALLPGAEPSEGLVGVKETRGFRVLPVPVDTVGASLVPLG